MVAAMPLASLLPLNLLRLHACACPSRSVTIFMFFRFVLVKTSILFGTPQQILGQSLVARLQHHCRLVPANLSSFHQHCCLLGILGRHACCRFFFFFFRIAKHVPFIYVFMYLAKREEFFQLLLHHPLASFHGWLASSTTRQGLVVVVVVVVSAHCVE
jgi:hypothetical protein